MKIEEDPKIKQIVIRKNLSKSRLNIYKIVLTDICTITGLTPTELLKEAKEEEQPFIKDNKIIFPDIEDRKVTQYIYQYYEFLKNKKLTINTIDSYLKTLRSFYNEYNIQLPKNIQLDQSKPLIKEGDIPAIKDIKKGVDGTNNIRDKAIILFMATTGIRTSDVIDFKISDLLEATKNYHDGTLMDLLAQKTNNLVPVWYFTPLKTIKKANICVTFNTPEATGYLFEYLKTRKNLDEDSYLFGFDNGKPISNFAIIHIFRRINDRVFFRNNEGKRFFHPHAMRKFFITTCNHNSSDITKLIYYLDILTNQVFMMLIMKSIRKL
ncbi:site-specific integrase [Methanobrevibacter arboriphilus]|uniref:tyrosine-type recombinase/integrase n=1 Tax=Methanobrevibacter arboriphilus TaxID=39441 RepID=UPI0006D0C2D9|nr:site-specific integrase [Methanobrevibacter arboriphilus]